MSMEKFIDWITGDDARIKRELLKLKCDTKHVWYVGDNVPGGCGRYLVLCKAGNKYVKAIADAELYVVNLAFQCETVWTVDRFLTDGPVKRSKRLKVIAWAKLETEEDDSDD